MTVSLIIPAYNEQKRLPAFLQSIVAFLRTHSSFFSEIIVVDDGSTDQTVAAAKTFQNQLPLTVVQLNPNQGKGAAVQAGMLSATGEYRLFMDADGATPITEAPKIIQALTTHDVAIGNRWIAGAKTTRHSVLRKLAGWTYRTYLRFFGLGGIDTMCGCKGYRQDVARTLFGAMQEKRWLFDTEIAYRAVQQRYSIAAIPIEWQSKEGSKLDTATLLKSAWNIWPLVQRLKNESPT